MRKNQESDHLRPIPPVGSGNKKPGTDYRAFKEEATVSLDKRDLVSGEMET